MPLISIRPTELPTDLGSWFSRTGRKYTLSVGDYRQLDNGFPMGFGVGVLARDVEDETQTQIMLDFDVEQRLYFEEFKREFGPDVNPTLHNHSWKATRDVFIETCKEALFHGLGPGVTKATVDSERVPGIRLTWNNDSSSASPISYAPAPDYERELAEVSEKFVLVALLARPLTGTALETLHEMTYIPVDLLRAVLGRAENRGLAVQQASGTFQLTPAGEQLAKEITSRSAGRSPIGF